MNYSEESKALCEPTLTPSAKKLRIPHFIPYVGLLIVCQTLLVCYVRGDLERDRCGIYYVRCN